MPRKTYGFRRKYGNDKRLIEDGYTQTEARAAAQGWSQLHKNLSVEVVPDGGGKAVALYLNGRDVS